MARRFPRWAIFFSLLLLAGPEGCGGLACQCLETLGAKRTRPGGETTLAPQQTGQPTTVTITIPAGTNASLCVC